MKKKHIKLYKPSPELFAEAVAERNRRYEYESASDLAICADIVNKMFVPHLKEFNIKRNQDELTGRIALIRDLKMFK